MTIPLIVDVPGPCVAWQRTATGKDGRRRTPTRQRDYQAHVRACAWAARARHPAPPPMDGRMSVRVYVCAADLRQRDVDNAAKTVLDACNRVLWSDDAQVDYLGSERLEPSKTHARIVLVVTPHQRLRTVAEVADELGVVLAGTAAQGRPQRAAGGRGGGGVPPRGQQLGVSRGLAGSKEWSGEFRSDREPTPKRHKSRGVL